MVTWRTGAALLASLGGGDVVLVGSFIGVVGRFVGVVGGRVTWRRGVVGGRWERRAHPGLAQMWEVTGVLAGGGAGRASWWWGWVVVVVVRGKMGRSQCVTSVTFQLRLLDLATRGRLLLINGNYY